MAVGAAVFVGGCASVSQVPPAEEVALPEKAADYLIGPGDTVNIFVWRNPELSATVPVRPDGKITTPRTEDGGTIQFGVRIDDLLNDGDIGANVEMMPGDVLIIPEAWF